MGDGGPVRSTKIEHPVIVLKIYALSQVIERSQLAPLRGPEPVPLNRPFPVHSTRAF